MIIVIRSSLKLNAESARRSWNHKNWANIKKKFNCRVSITRNYLPKWINDLGKPSESTQN